MSWRDRLRQAKLGAVPFLVESTGGQLGRNTQVHEYPNRDEPYVEDLGRKARRFTLDAYVLADKTNGFDYMAARDALIAELETAGSKTLVHPYLGELRVTVVEVDGPRESTREGGMARFAITVVESGEQVFPAAIGDTQAQARQQADAALEQSQQVFVESFDAAGQMDYVSTSAADLVRDVATQLTTLTTRVTTTPAALTEFVDALGEMSDAASQLILVPQSLASTVAGLFARIGSIASEPPAALAIVRQLFGYGDHLPATPDTGAASRNAQRANQTAFVNLVQQASLITAVQVVTTMQIDSSNTALTLRDELLDVFDTLDQRVSNDELYYALAQLRTAVVNDLQQRSAQLNQLITLTLPASVSALVLAYELYGDSLREAELVARNALRDPLFVSSGATLEVLSA